MIQTPNSLGGQIHSSAEGVENFWTWFSGSKVTDEFGDPLVVYHGTGCDISEFRVSGTGILGAGVYFTSDPVDAEEYAYGENGGENVLPVYLSIRTPLEVTAEGGWPEITKAAIGKDIDDDEPSEAEAQEVMQALLVMGYDGIVSRTDRGPIHFAVFDPTQIKSAIGNNGTFDPHCPRIDG